MSGTVRDGGGPSDRISEREWQELRSHWPAVEAEPSDARAALAPRDRLENFDEAEERTLRALLARLIPEPGEADLPGHVDREVGKPNGRGDWPQGLPPELDLFRRGLAELGDLPDLAPEAQDGRIRRFRAAGEWRPEFLDRLFAKALGGYLGHPATWRRIGFYGPAYPEGYVWVDGAQVARRRARAAGWSAR